MMKNGVKLTTMAALVVTSTALLTALSAAADCTPCCRCCGAVTIDPAKVDELTGNVAVDLAGKKK